MRLRIKTIDAADRMHQPYTPKERASWLRLPNRTEYR